MIPMNNRFYKHSKNNRHHRVDVSVSAEDNIYLIFDRKVETSDLQHQESSVSQQWQQPQ